MRVVLFVAHLHKHGMKYKIITNLFFLFYKYIFNSVAFDKKITY